MVSPLIFNPYIFLLAQVLGHLLSFIPFSNPSHSGPVELVKEKA